MSSGGGNGKTGLGHHGEQRGGLERDGFAAGVGAGDDELAVGGGELKGDGNNNAAVGLEAFLEERMAGRFKTERVWTKDGRYTVEFAGEAGAGEKAVDQSEDASAVDEGWGEGGDLTRERDEDAVDFGLLFFDEADELVVLLDGFEGFDENCLARRTGAMDDAGDAALELGTNGNDEAVAADGDEVFLSGAVGGELTQRGAQGLFNDALLALLLAANAAQLGRGTVGESAVGLDGAFDGLCQRAKRWWLAKQSARRGRGACRLGARAATGAGIARRRRRWRGGRWLETRRPRGLRRGCGLCRRAGWGQRGRRAGWRLVRRA